MIPEKYHPKPEVRLSHPQWSKNAAIYQINTRQFSPQGTFQAIEQQLPRLKALGVDLLWIMPIHPIGLTNRKGTLGSPYAVQDYYAINPEFGTEADFAHLVQAIHAAGLYIILDWVPNHTAWDNPLAAQHPTWYDRDYKGDFRPTPWWDWSDIIDLNYQVPELRQYMTEAMCHWVRQYDIDGFRCDVAGFVPLDFWETLRAELDAIKPVFLLAEWENRDMHRDAFDMTYGWSWKGAVQSICAGKADVSALYNYYSWNEKAFPKDGYRMLMVSNHDINSWEGTELELFGDGLEAAITLSVISEGLPLIYNGQEAGNPKRLAFFEKDPIQWQPHRQGQLYQTLLAIKKAHTPLWNGKWGARMINVPNNHPNQVFSFVRQDENDKVFAVFNFSAQPLTIQFKETLCHGSYTNAFTNQPIRFDEASTCALPAWGYQVFLKA